LALLIAAASCEEVKNEQPKEAVKDEKNIEKRGLSDFGDWGSSSYGGHHESHGHHEHIKTVTIEKKVPVPYEVIKKIPYTVEKKIPYEVKVRI
jgi:hypothetical protein